MRARKPKKPKKINTKPFVKTIAKILGPPKKKGTEPGAVAGATKALDARMKARERKRRKRLGVALST